MDQLSLVELCHSKLGPLQPEPGEVFTCKWSTETSKALRLLTEMLEGAENGSLTCTTGGVREGPRHLCRMKCASLPGIMIMTQLPSGHQAVLTLIELFMDDVGSHYVGSYQNSTTASM